MRTAVLVFGASRHVAEDGCSRAWVLKGPRRSQCEVLLWEAVVEEIEWLMHMCVSQRIEHDVAQVSESPDSRTLA